MSAPETICAAVRDQFALHLYGELTRDEAARVDSHVTACPECRRLLEARKNLHAVFHADAAVPAPALLASCREQFSATLATPQPRVHFLDRFLNAAWRPSWRPASAFAMLAAGFFAARLVPAPRPDAKAVITTIGTARASVRDVSARQDGRVDIVLDETRRRTVSGTPRDRAIRDLLLAASKEAPDPALRAGSMAILAGGEDSDDVRNTLVFVLEHDQNQSVRAKAIDGLRPYASEPAVRSALAHVLLREADRSMRTRAIDLLAAPEQSDLDREIVGALQEMMVREEDAYVRDRGSRVLKAVKASAGIY